MFVQGAWKGKMYKKMAWPVSFIHSFFNAYWWLIMSGQRDKDMNLPLKCSESQEGGRAIIRCEKRSGKLVGGELGSPEKAAWFAYSSGSQSSLCIGIT